MTAFARDESGATSIEYALIATFISIVIVGMVSSIGSHVKTLLQGVMAGL